LMIRSILSTPLHRQVLGVNSSKNVLDILCRQAANFAAAHAVTGEPGLHPIDWREKVGIRGGAIGSTGG
jgi:hypothetical protein